MKNSYYLKPLTSFLKDPNIPILDKFTYADQTDDKENEYGSHRHRLAPSSVTRMIPFYDENALKNQQIALVNMIEQIRQLKTNNQGLLKDNTVLEKELSDNNIKLTFYEDVLLKLYKERPLKEQGTGGLRQKFTSQDQRDLDSLMKDIMKRQQEEGKHKENDMNKGTSGEFYNMNTRDMMVQTNLPMGSDNLKDMMNSPRSPRSPRSPKSPKGKGGGFSSHLPKDNISSVNKKDKKSIMMIKIEEVSAEEMRLKIGKIRKGIQNIFKDIKDVSKVMPVEDFAFMMSFPFHLEDGEDLIIQFRETELYNALFTLSLWSFIYKILDWVIRVFKMIFELQWILDLCSCWQKTSYSHNDFFIKYNEILRINKTSNFSNENNEEMIKFMAFLSLYDDIPASTNKISLLNPNNDEITMNKFSKKRISKLKSKITNLETKFLIYLLYEKFKDHATIYKLYFTKYQELCIFVHFDLSKIPILKYFNQKLPLSISLNEEFLDILKLEPCDNKGIPLSLKVELNQMSFEEIHKININKIIPYTPKISPKASDKKGVLIKNEKSNIGKNEANKLIDQNNSNNEKKQITEEKINKEENKEDFKEIDKKPEKKSVSISSNLKDIDLENVRFKADYFYDIKREFLHSTWPRILEKINFNSFYIQSKNSLILTKNYRLSAYEIDLYEKFLEKLAFYISNKILINYEQNNIKIFELGPKSLEWSNLLKKFDFGNISSTMKRAVQVIKDEETIEKRHLIQNYWNNTKKNPMKIWMRATDEFIPLDFINNFAILPSLFEKNFIHSLINYFPLESNSKGNEDDKMLIFIDLYQIYHQMIRDIISLYDLNVMKTYRSFEDFCMIEKYDDKPNNRFILTLDHIGFFDLKPSYQLFCFYEKLMKYVGVNNVLLLAFNDFIAIFIKLMILPGIAHFVLMSYFERYSLEYKLTVMIYSFIMIVFHIKVIKTCLRYISQYKACLGIVQARINANKQIIFKEFWDDIKPFIRKLTEYEEFVFYMGEFFLILKICFMFLALFAAKCYITYGFSLLKIQWVKNETIITYNFYFDINQFLPDLFDFITLSFFIMFFKNYLIMTKMSYYFSKEKIIKDIILFLFRILCEFNGLFQIIFIYPSISNCIKYNCLSMSQQMYKDILVIYFFYKIIQWFYCLMKHDCFFSLKKSFEQTLLSQKAKGVNKIVEKPKTFSDMLNNNIDNNNNNVNKPNEIKKTDEINNINLEQPNNDTSPFEYSPTKKTGKIYKFLHICSISNKIMYIKKIDSIFFQGTVLEKSYDIIIDLLMMVLYNLSFSALFSLDVCLYWVMLFLECYFVKFKLIFLYKSIYTNNFNDFIHWKYCFILLIFTGIVFNVGLMAFQFDTFFDYLPIMIFFVVVGGLNIFVLIIFLVRDDYFEETKDKLISDRQTLINVFQLLK